MRLLVSATAIALAVARATEAYELQNPHLNQNQKRDDAVNSLLEGIRVSSATGPINGMPTDLADAEAAVLAGNFTSKLHMPIRDQCPSGCSLVGTNTSSWFVYGDLRRLDRACNKTTLLDFAVSNPLDVPKAHVAISACTADLSGGSTTSSSVKNACAKKGVEQLEQQGSLDVTSSGASSTNHTATVIAALEQLRSFAALAGDSCEETIKYAYLRDVSVGVYSGAGLAGQGVLEKVLEKVRARIIESNSVAEDLVVQLCSESDASARYSLGVHINTKHRIGTVQKSIQTWKNSSCVKTTPQLLRAGGWASVSFQAPPIANSTGLNSTSIRSRADSVEEDSKNLLSARANCKYIKVEGGDVCDTLAAQCGITVAEFKKYNTRSNKPDPCALQPGEHVCCSSGTLPDFAPKPDSDGYCHKYMVKTGDNCAALAAEYDLTNEKIEQFNKKTWGWNGCEKMFSDYYICLSSGYPPMPMSIPNAVCGPQVNDTAKAPPGTDLSTLNQCALNACCNIWGQCGTTGEFCTPSNSSTGAPGTAAPGENGCISNCGMDVLTSGPPASKFHIAYFEAWNWGRACLRMAVNDIDTSVYTHIHYSFITINTDFTLSTKDVAEQMPLFTAMTGIKKIISIGGWAFSTEPATYQIFRDAVATKANRKTLADSIIKFLDDYQLDGVDWDWEYPAEPDIPGIPPGTEEETTGFFLLLAEIKAKLPTGKTQSVTAPASYWYLKQFPIQAISLASDYLVFMTYDLHGQWDYGNKHASPGCVSHEAGLGNCLRSHVNLTETINSLSMITKAGVPSNMIAVGVSSYGRSFQMSTPGCWTEQCTFTGPESGAMKGRCTETGGYLADYEIEEVLRKNPSAKKLMDKDSYSNIVVWDSDQWVAYMDKDNKDTRKALYPAMNFLGSADWAVDLQYESGGGGGRGGNSSSEQNVYVDPKIWSSASPVVTGSPGVTLIWPPKPLSTPSTISFPPWTTMVTYSSLTTKTSTLPSGGVTSYPSYVYVSFQTIITIPPVVTTEIPFWGVSIASDSTSGPIALTSSIQPPPFAITVTPVISGTTSIIGATKTETNSTGVIIWGTVTYTPPTETWTIGGSTKIIGGTTLPPTVVTVTPHPHPTTTHSPGHTDPAVIIKPTWTKGPTLKPVATPGCPGCGTSCVLFCNPGCPNCPPGTFGNNGGQNDKEPDDDSDDDDSNDDDSHTILFDEVPDHPFPTAYADSAAMASVFKDVKSSLASLLTTSTSTTSTKTTSTKTSTTSEKPKPTATVECRFGDALVYYRFGIYQISGWGGENGKRIHDEMKGCGAVTGWRYESSSTGNPDVAWCAFNLPFIIKSGCVERAIKSAGGPELSCKGDGFNIPAMASTFSADVDEMNYEEFYRNMTDPALIAHHEYHAPEGWGDVTEIKREASP